MDEKTFKKLSGRLEQANRVIGKLDPILRGDAWAILRPYVTEEEAQPGSERESSKQRERTPSSNSSEDELIEKFESEKEADNLWLTFAILFKRHGRGPFSLDLIKAVGKALDLTLPERPDTTIRNSTKKVVRKQEGGYKIQPGGEKFLKETYGVTKGKLAIPGSA